MYKNTRQLVARIGETDQLYLDANTPELALERAELRLELVTLSSIRQEQIHFLQEAVVLLEQGRISFEEMPMRLYIELSLCLAKAYMIFYELTHENKYAVVTQQILKPLSIQENGNIFFFLAYAAAVKQEPAMTKYWISKYINTAELDWELLNHHHAFVQVKQSDWFKQIAQTRLH